MTNKTSESAKISRGEPLAQPDRGFSAGGRAPEDAALVIGRQDWFIVPAFALDGAALIR